MHTDQGLGLISTVKVKAEGVDEYIRTLMTLMEQHSTREPDCIDITVHRGADDPTLVMLYERWRIPPGRFVREQMTKAFIADFTRRTRHLVSADEDVTYWLATEVVAEGRRTALAGQAM